MLSKIKRIEEEALQLTARERAQLAERLINSLDDEEDQETERLWLKEAGIRYQEFGECKKQAIPAGNQDELSWFEKNFEQLLEQYDGQWLAIYQDRVVATGSTMTDAWQKAKDHGCESPFLVAVGRQGWSRDTYD